MAKPLNAKQQQLVADAIAILNPPANKKSTATKQAEKGVTDFVYKPRRQHRDILQDDLKSDVAAMRKAVRALNRDLPAHAAGAVRKEALRRGIGDQEISEHYDDPHDVEVRDLADRLEREADIREKAIDHVPRWSKGRGELSDKDLVWQHTEKIFGDYRPKALVKDREAYATLIYQARTGKIDHAWDWTKRKAR